MCIQHHCLLLQVLHGYMRHNTRLHLTVSIAARLHDMLHVAIGLYWVPGKPNVILMLRRRIACCSPAAARCSCAALSARRNCQACADAAAQPSRGLPGKQSSIMHVTLGRVLTAEPLPEAVAARMSEKAAEWSARVRGMRWSAPELTHIQEESFSTVAGPRTAFPWKS